MGTMTMAVQGGQVVTTIHGERLVVVRVRQVFVVAVGPDLVEREILRADVAQVARGDKADRGLFVAYWARERKAAVAVAAL